MIEGGPSAMGICALFYIYIYIYIYIYNIYIYRSAMRSAKFGVVVFKASILNWLGGQSAMGICALFYI